MQISFGGLGRHTEAAGGPAGPDELFTFFKVTPFDLHRTISGL